MMPMEPAKEVSRVRPFFVRKLLKLRASEVQNDMEDFPMFLCFGRASLVLSTS